MRLLAPLLVIAGVVAFAISARGGTPATAIAPCLPHANTAQESQMLSMVIAWRAQNVSGAGALAVSGPLNAAAAGYAQYLIDHPGASGHYADGSDWSSRAQQCGFASNASGQAAGGEGLARAASPADALAEMASHAGSGIWIPASVGLPVKCAGIAKATSADGTRTAWIVMLFARSGDCPGPPLDPPPTFPSTGTTQTPANTATATASPLSTAIPTATSTPTASANYGLSVTILPGWNLVTLPQGPLSDILDTAAGCYRAVYRLEGEAWGKFAPGVPRYVNTMTHSSGGAVWLEGILDCGAVPI